MTEKTEIQEHPRVAALESGWWKGRKGRKGRRERKDSWTGDTGEIRRTLEHWKYSHKIQFMVYLIGKFTSRFVVFFFLNNQTEPPLCVTSHTFFPISYGTKSYPKETDTSPTVNSNKYYTWTNLLGSFNINQSLKQPWLWHFQNQFEGPLSSSRSKSLQQVPYQDCPHTGIIPKGPNVFPKMLFFFLPKDLGLTLHVQNYKLS